MSGLCEDVGDLVVSRDGHHDGSKIQLLVSRDAEELGEVLVETRGTRLLNVRDDSARVGVDRCRQLELDREELKKLLIEDESFAAGALRVELRLGR